MGSSRTLAPAPPLPTTHIKDTKGINNMALVTKEAQALESRLEWDLAAKCSNYQQLFIMKKNQGNEQGIQNATSCAGMTPSERLIWYRANQPAVELDAERCAQSSNYRQLLLARGVRAIEETDEERAERSATRSEALMWYRNGGLELMDAVQVVQGHPAACRQPHRQHEQALVGLQEQGGGQRLHHLPQGGELERERRGASSCPQSGDESRECGQEVLRSLSPSLGGGAAGGGECQEGVCRAICRGAYRAAEENHRGDAHQQDRVCRVHQVSSASSDEGGRRRCRRLENCSSHRCRCHCLRRQNMNKGKDATNHKWINGPPFH